MRYYASVMDDSSSARKVGFLSGPYETHQEALDALPAAKRKALDADSAAAFYYFGTLSVSAEPYPVAVFGVLDSSGAAIAPPT